MSRNTLRTEGEPHDRLTRIGAAMLDARESHPESGASDRCVIFLTDGSKAGTIMDGYGEPPDDRTAMVDVFMHLAAVFEANGITLKMVPLPQTPEGGSLS